MITPIEIGGKIVSRKDRSLLSIRREAERLEPKKLPAELSRSQIRKLGNAMNGVRIKLLVPLGSAKVGLEDVEPVIVLLRSSVGLPKRLLEACEVVLCVEKQIVTFRNDLSDQNILVVYLLRSYGRDDRRG